MNVVLDSTGLFGYIAIRERISIQCRGRKNHGEHGAHGDFSRDKKGSSTALVSVPSCPGSGSSVFSVFSVVFPFMQLKSDLGQRLSQR